MRSKFTRIIVLSAALLAASAHAEDFRWDSRVQHGRLENGFSYYIVSGKEMANQVSIQLLVRAGSLDERDNQSGVAHMVEHMVFHATTAHPEGLRSWMESQGWRIGKHYNAQTNFERTLYQLALDSRPERINSGMDALADIAGGAQLPADSLERERQIILEEWRTKLGVRERMDRQRRAMLREGSLYPERPTIGNENSIRQQPAETLRQFYHDWYRPANMALIVVGNVDAAAVEDGIRQRFGALQPAALPARNPADPQLREQLRVVRLQDAESGASQVGWVTRFATDKRQDDAGLRERIIDRIAERSLRALVRRAALQLPSGVESLTSSKGDLGATTASLGFAASVAVDGHQAGLQQIQQLRERVLRAGLIDEDIRAEIEDVRRLNEKGPSQQAARDFSGWMQLLGEAVQDDRVLQDPQQKQAQIRQILASLKPEQINARVRAWVGAPDNVVFMMAPGLSPLQLPSEAEVRNRQQAIAQQPLAPLPTPAKPATVAPPAALAAAATNGEVLQQEDIGAGVQRWRLENGDTLIWMHAPKDSMMRFTAQTGAGYRVPGAPSWQWQLSAQLGRDADLPAQTEGTLSHWASARKLQLSQGQSETSLTYSGQSQPAQLEDLLRLYAARLQTEPGMEALSATTRQLARQSARRPDSVSERAAAEMSRLRYSDTQHDGYPAAAELKALATPAGLQTVRQQWQRLRQQPATYYLSGPADEDTVRELSSRYLAGIPRHAGDTAPVRLTQHSGYHESRLAIGIEPQGSVRAMGSQPMQWSPDRAMRTAILARIAYRNLRQELRENEAGIYRLNYKLSLEAESDRLTSELSFTAAPDRLDELWAAARRVLEKLPSQLDDAMLAEEIQQIRIAESKRLNDGPSQFVRLQLSYSQFGDGRYLEDSKHLTDHLTPQSVRDFAQQLKLTDDMAVVKLLPKPAVAIK